MVVAENAAAHDGQVGVAAYEIVGEQAHEIQQLAEGSTLDLHGSVLVVEHDAVFVVVHIGAVLQVPGAVVDGQRDDAVVLAGRMVHAARIALVLGAQLALGVGALGSQLGSGDGLGVLFRLGKVDGDVQITVRRLGHPLQVPLDGRLLTESALLRPLMLIASMLSSQVVVVSMVTVKYVSLHLKLTLISLMLRQRIQY